MAEVEWSIEAARSGEPTLKLARRHVHSRYDPRREAKLLAQQVLDDARLGGHDSLVIIGSGLGYVTNAISASFDGPVLVWDPLPDLDRELAPHLDKANAQKKHVRLRSTRTHDFDVALKQLGTQPYFWIHPGYEHVCRFEARYALRSLRQRTPTAGKLRQRDAIVSERALDAIGHLPFSPVVDDLGQCLDGQTAVIASGGPSLLSVMPSLAKYSGGARFACVQVLGVFDLNSAHVHFAVSVDLRNIFKTARLDDGLPYDVLLADSSSAPTMLDIHRQRTCLFHQRTAHIHHLLWQKLGLDIIDEPNVSVSETALLLAHRMGARRFILAGVDFDSNDSRYREHFSARCSSGRMAATNSHYFHASRYLSDTCLRLREEGCEILRVGDGLTIDGCKNIGPDEFDDVIRALPDFSTPKLNHGPNAERLQASRSLYREIARSPGATGPSRTCEDGISREHPGWRALDSRTSKRIAQHKLSNLDRRSGSSVPTP